jgi:catechol 2,3-dioxygenase-like lactoylglutathione lyase family enzyme
MARSSTQPIECAPVFVVSDLAASLAYYRDRLGFDVAFTWGEPTFYAGVCRGAVTIHLQAASQTARPAGASSLCVFVGSADDVHRELAGRGARILKPPASYPYGMRDFDVADLDGNTLVFGHPVEAPSG